MPRVQYHPLRRDHSRRHGPRSRVPQIRDPVAPICYKPLGNEPSILVRCLPAPAASILAVRPGPSRARRSDSGRLSYVVTDQPPVFSDEVRNLSFQIGQPIRPVELPPATGGSGTLTYSLQPEVPGLTFDRQSRILSGTPTSAGSYSMTYEARDQNRKTIRLLFDINVAQSSSIGSILSAVAVGNAAGVLRLADMPEPSGGPAVSVSGNRLLVAGGSIFLDVAPEAGATAEKLLISLGGESFGYYEIVLPRPASSYRLVGQVPFNFDPSCRSHLHCGDRGRPQRGIRRGGLLHGRHEARGGRHSRRLRRRGSNSLLELRRRPRPACCRSHAGAEVFYGSTAVDSGGVLDLEAGYPCGADILRNEHIAWALGSPPPGIYEVRVSHYLSCGAPETNYVVSIYNHGRRTTFSGTFTGSGGDSARGTGRVIAQFEVAGDGPPPRQPNSLSSAYRGSGDQVFVLNPDGEVLDDTVYSLHLGDSSAEVYVIATAGNRHMEHRVELLDRRKAAAQDRAAAMQDGQQASRPAVDEVSPRLQWITAFNNFGDGPPVWEGSADPSQSQAVGARPAVAVGDHVSFFDLVDEVLVPAYRPHGGDRRPHQRGPVGGRPGMGGLLRQPWRLHYSRDGERGRTTVSPSRLE